MNEIQTLRRKIDAIDQQMSDLFCQRMELVRDVAKVKLNLNCAIYDKRREETVIKEARERCECDELQAYQAAFFLHLMKLSRDYQQSIMTQK